MLSRIRRFLAAIIVITTLTFASACTTTDAVYWSKIAIGVADQIVNAP